MTGQGGHTEDEMKKNVYLPLLLIGGKMQALCNSLTTARLSLSRSFASEILWIFKYPDFKRQSLGHLSLL